MCRPAPGIFLYSLEKLETQALPNCDSFTRAPAPPGNFLTRAPSPQLPTTTQQCVCNGAARLVPSNERLRSKLFRHASAHDSTVARWPRRRRCPRPRAPRVPCRRRCPASPPSPRPRAPRRARSSIAREFERRFDGRAMPRRRGPCRSRRARGPRRADSMPRRTAVSTSPSSRAPRAAFDRRSILGRKQQRETSREPASRPALLLDPLEAKPLTRRWSLSTPLSSPSR